MSRSALALFLLILLTTACARQTHSPSPQATVMPPFQLTSPAFSPGETIPIPYTCDGQDQSPPLAWSSPPANTRALALIMDDPDAPAGTWVHWVIFNIPATTSELAQAIPPIPQLNNGAIQGINSWGRVGYGGPCPPRGQKHRYFFTLYALDTPLNLKGQPTSSALLQAMEDHILGKAQLMGVYQRP